MELDCPEDKLLLHPLQRLYDILYARPQGTTRLEIFRIMESEGYSQSASRNAFTNLRATFALVTTGSIREQLYKLSKRAYRYKTADRYVPMGYRVPNAPSRYVKRILPTVKAFDWTVQQLETYPTERQHLMHFYLTAIAEG